MPTVYELGLIVGAAVGGGTLASIATRYIHRPEVSTIVALLLTSALAAVVTVLVLARTVAAQFRSAITDGGTPVISAATRALLDT